jgi:hypothetical protein
MKFENKTLNCKTIKYTQVVYLKNNILYFIFFLCIIIILIDFLLLNVLHFEYSLTNNQLPVNYIPEGNPTNDPTDPVRYWPSGVPQGATIIGSDLAVFAALSKLSNCSPRLKVLGALGSMSVSATTVAYQTAIENPVGFNRFMFGLSEYNRTQKWPSIEEIKNSVSDSTLNQFKEEALKKVDQNLVNRTVQEVLEKINKGSNFISDNTLINKLMDRFFESVSSVLKPVHV